MTTDKVKDTAQAVAFVLAVLFFILLGVGFAFGQEHSHTNDSFERFELMRLLPPAKITNVEPNEFGTRIEYVISDRRQVRNGSFQIGKGTEKVGEVKKGKFYWLLYCSADDFLVTIVPVGANQTK